MWRRNEGARVLRSEGDDLFAAAKADVGSVSEVDVAEGLLVDAATRAGGEDVGVGVLVRGHRARVRDCVSLARR